MTDSTSPQHTSLQQQAALSLERDDVGQLSVGASADFAVLDAPSHLHIAYRPGSQLVSQTWIAGRRVV